MNPLLASGTITMGTCTILFSTCTYATRLGYPEARENGGTDDVDVFSLNTYILCGSI